MTLTKSAPAKVGEYGVPIVEDGPKFAGTDVAVSELFRCLRDARLNLPTFLTLFPEVTLERARDAHPHKDAVRSLPKLPRRRASDSRRHCGGLTRRWRVSQPRRRRSRLLGRGRQQRERRSRRH